MEPAVLESKVSESETKSLWVFGYGSLCYKPGFEFNKATLGSVNGFQRRFWQGNVTHRGTKEQVCLTTNNRTYIRLNIHLPYIATSDTVWHLTHLNFTS